MTAVLAGPVVDRGSGPAEIDLAGSRRRRGRRRRAVLVTLAGLVAMLAALSVLAGEPGYSPAQALAALRGADPGAAFVLAELRLPRAATALLVGACFGLAGTTFQTLLRNPLASPDVIGIDAGASLAALLALVVWRVGGPLVGAYAVTAALATAAVVYLTARVDGRVAAGRLVLVGVGVAAMLDGAVAYVLLRAAEWDLQVAMRWLTGSLTNATWDDVVPVAVALAVLGPLLLSRAGPLQALRLGDDTATAIGVRVETTRVVVVLAAVGLVAFATAAAGPVAFVAFLSGPIAARLVGTGGSLLLPAALVGATLVLGGDLVGRLAFDTAYPVGVVTGALGAPFLLLLVMRAYRSGGVL